MQIQDEISVVYLRVWTIIIETGKYDITVRRARLSLSSKPTSLFEKWGWG